MPLTERIERNSIPEPNSGCWLWICAIAVKRPGTLGYGTMTVGPNHARGANRVMAAHRVAYREFRGDIPDGMLVCHRCDNSLCVNPDHLFLGTYQDNMDDRSRKGRDNSRHGEKNSSAKLTDDDVRSIRRLRNETSLSLSEIAQRFGVSINAVHNIVSGKGWAHISGDGKPARSFGP